MLSESGVFGKWLSCSTSTNRVGVLLRDPKSWLSTLPYEEQTVENWSSPCTKTAATLVFTFPACRTAPEEFLWFNAFHDSSSNRSDSQWLGLEGQWWQQQRNWKKLPSWLWRSQVVGGLSHLDYGNEHTYVLSRHGGWTVSILICAVTLCFPTFSSFTAFLCV